MGTPANSPSNLSVMPSNAGPSKRMFGELAITPAIEQAVTEIKLSAQIALMMPRDEKAATDALLELCDDPVFADQAIWEKKQGRKKDETTGQWVDNYIDGYSIRFTEAATILWKHIRSSDTVVLDTEGDGDRPGERTIAVSVWDCQANTSYSSQVHLRKVVERSNADGRQVISERLNSNNRVVFLVHATDDEMQNAQAAKVSKAIRTLQIRILSPRLKKVCWDRCNRTLRTEAERNLPEKRKQMVAGFAAVGVSLAMLERQLSHSIDATNVDELMALSNVLRGIREGETTWKEYVSPPVVVDSEGDEKPTPEPRKEPERAATTRPAMKAAADQSSGKPGAVASKVEGDGQQLGLGGDAPVEAGTTAIAIEVDDALSALSGGEHAKSAKIEKAAREELGLPATGDLTKPQLVKLRDKLRALAE